MSRRPARSLGRSDSAGRTWLGRALELKYRLPRLWQRILEGEVWRAMKIADHAAASARPRSADGGPPL